jgi:hypothetical protein
MTFTPEQMRVMAEGLDKEDKLQSVEWGDDEYQPGGLAKAASMLRYAADQLAAESAPPTPGERKPGWLNGQFKRAGEDVAALEAALNHRELAQAGGDPPPPTSGIADRVASGATLLRGPRLGMPDGKWKCRRCCNLRWKGDPFAASCPDGGVCEPEPKAEPSFPRPALIARLKRAKNYLPIAFASDIDAAIEAVQADAEVT